MAIVQVKGRKIFYEDNSGEGGSLIYIHGSGSNHEIWAQQMHLKPNCFALDLPGHGQSEGLPAKTIAESTEYVVEFVNTVNPPRPLYLVGHSMGGAIALTYALKYPDALDGMILIGTGYRMRVNPAFLEALSKGKYDHEFIRIAFAAGTDPELVQSVVDSRAQVSPSILYTNFSACNEFDMSGQLDQLRVATLVIVGMEDRMTPLKLSQYLTDHITSSRLEIIRNAGHFVMLEQPDQLNLLIEEFCSQKVAPNIF